MLYSGYPKSDILKYFVHKILIFLILSIKQESIDWKQYQKSVRKSIMLQNISIVVNAVFFLFFFTKKY